MQTARKACQTHQRAWQHHQSDARRHGGTCGLALPDVGDALCGSIRRSSADPALRCQAWRVLSPV